MSNPNHSLFWMAVYLALVGALVAVLFVPLQDAFLANWGFNSLILGVLAIGLIINLQQVLALHPEIAWIRHFRTGNIELLEEHPRLMKPLSRHLHGRRKDRFRLSALSLRTLLDGIRSRLDESREISRYVIGLLIFLGLLGTFWGLLDTVGSIGQVIAGLDVSGGAVDEVFTTLKTGLEAPLAGMGTAFSSSLFGLGGSLILGFLDLQAGHAQNRFFNDLEEWLSGLTQLIDEPEMGGPATHSPIRVVETATTSTTTTSADTAALLDELRAQRQVLEALLAAQTGSRAPAPDATAEVTATHKR
ncbi:flagellar motor protein MotA [Lamprobacter modestohalophilus]|uniref:flagellar motor protein MotA n=1 Tax=Lamprobacter modestohalophilus TaxID=1064514 RepID=UPI002ADEB9C5|nr:flagellar motor protein MotA [Lamprobacter modestohalophilus]MEA1048798.1 flagellar motor protein MotA [Lamprobacter modestohalophilus]